MALIQLDYLATMGPQPDAINTAALDAVPNFDAPDADPEAPVFTDLPVLQFLGLTLDSASVAIVEGVWRKRIVVATTPTFVENFPNRASQEAAVSSLFTTTIAARTGARVTAVAPAFL